MKEHDDIREMERVAWAEFYNSAMEYIEKNNLKKSLSTKGRDKERGE